MIIGITGIHTIRRGSSVGTIKISIIFMHKGDFNNDEYSNKI